MRSAPSGRPTPPRLTDEILDGVRRLERTCPTPDEAVLSRLAGTWELLWTAQDFRSPELGNNSNNNAWQRALLVPFARIINPLENQAYSNNPEGAATPSTAAAGGTGRANPFLPLGLQNRLEQAGWVFSDSVGSSAAPVRSTQAIDVKAGLIRNVVSVPWMVAVGPSQPQSPPQRRASLTVTVRFRTVPANLRRVAVRFERCRVYVPGTMGVDWDVPLGWTGPTGWLQTVYVDDDLPVTRGHKGSVFVLTKPKRASV